MRRRASSPSESKRHAGCTFILGRLDRHPVARGAGGYLPTGGSHPPRKSSRLSRSRRLWRSYFAAKAGLFWNGPATGVLASAPIRYCFSQSVQKRIGASLLRSSFYGTLVRMEAKAAWSALRAMHSDLGESISRAWNDPCMLKAALWSEALFSALDYMQPGHIGDYYVIKALEVLFLLHAQREGLALPPQCDYHTHSQIETIREIQKYLVGHLDERLTIQMLIPTVSNLRHSVEVLFPSGVWSPDSPVSPGTAHGPGRGTPHYYDPERAPDLYSSRIFQRQPVRHRVQAALPYASLPISTECK